MQPKIYSATEHDIDPAKIDPDVIFVINRLRGAGYSAYLVGGGVRDLLIGRTPKDFDISTSARPEEIKQLFPRNCLLIGRRFRLAHVRFGHKILEVSTFRSGENESDLILHDNVWGTEEQDVLRRDFTINGLFYDPTHHAVIDYVGGWDDIHDGILRSIGDPVVRFKQDPVRMIRLLKFRARFNFEIDLPAMQALIKCRREIIKSSPARVLEEIFRMLESGAAEPFFRLMTMNGLLELLFPPLTHFLVGKHKEEVFHMLQCADKVNLSNMKKPLDRSIMLACLLYPILVKEIETQFLKKKNVPHISDILMLTSSILNAVISSSFSHFPKRISSQAAFILTTQYRLTPLTGKKFHRPKLLHHKEFDLALTFLKLRSIADASVEEDYRFWKNAYKQLERHGDRRSHHPPPIHAPSS